MKIHAAGMAFAPCHGILLTQKPQRAKAEDEDSETDTDTRQRYSQLEKTRLNRWVRAILQTKELRNDSSQHSQS